MIEKIEAIISDGNSQKYVLLLYAALYRPVY